MPFLLVLVLAPFLFAFGTWVLMLIIGGMHSSIEAIPPLGFWATLPFSVLLSVIQGGFRK